MQFIPRSTLNMSEQPPILKSLTLFFCVQCYLYQVVFILFMQLLINARDPYLVWISRTIQASGARTNGHFYNSLAVEVTFSLLHLGARDLPFLQITVHIPPATPLHIPPTTPLHTFHQPHHCAHSTNHTTAHIPPTTPLRTFQQPHHCAPEPHASVAWEVWQLHRLQQ